MTLNKSVTRCKRCVMCDVGDDAISFDVDGVCNYCTDALVRKPREYFPSKEGQEKLEKLISELKSEGIGKRYDCLMGLSGGLDSSYLAYLGAAKWGLRIAAVHVDDGYDTEISTANIQKLCKRANIELIIISPDPEQYNSLVLAYMRAGVPNLAIPQDNILLACLYDYAKKSGIKNFLSGGNFALECILQKGNTWAQDDIVNIKDIHKRFGTKPIDKLKFISGYQKKIDARILGITTFRPLNYINYNRNRAFEELNKYCNFEYYGRKHLENYLTAFLQLYWLPKKFNVDKRTSHLSSMIISDQLAREEALSELDGPLYDELYMEKTKLLICEKIGITTQELEGLIVGPNHQHDDYRVDKKLNLARGLYKATNSNA